MEQVFNDLFNKVQKVFEKSKGSHDLEHTLRVLKMAERIAKEEKADINVVRFSAILHDIGRSIQDKTKGKLSHADIGAQMAQNMLSGYNLPKDFVLKVVNCIRKHRFRKGDMPETIEEKILYDADKLDAIGAIGIGRAFVFAGECGAKVHNLDIDIMKTKSYTKEDTAYREYMVKLRYVKDKIYTNSAKKIADKRHDFMKEFFNRLNLEAAGND